VFSDSSSISWRSLIVICGVLIVGWFARDCVNTIKVVDGSL
jgi:hypothetical protein